MSMSTSPAMQAMLTYPLKWCGMVLPVTPAKLLPYLDAPIPALAGINETPDDEQILTECIVVDAARGLVSVCCSSYGDDA